MAELTREELRQLARVHPVAWAMYASEGKWKRAKHLMWLADQLMRLSRGEIHRLAVSMPPRHGKSEFISKYFPTWWLGAFPQHRVISCSYGEALTTEWSRAARDAMSEHGPAVFGVETISRSAARAWDIFLSSNATRTGGSLRAVGKGGALTGRGADLLICDDLVRDAQEAANPTLRQTAWDWFCAVPLTRLEPGGKAIVVMTRWHHDDIVGRLVEQQQRGEAGEPWTIVNLPAVAEENDPLGRDEGEALWPARYPLHVLDRIRKDVGPYVWGALYQGQPTPAEGALFKAGWFHSFQWQEAGVGQPPRLLVPTHGLTTLAELRTYVTVDLAASEKTRADYTVIAVWGIHPAWRTLFLLDVIRVRLDGPDILPRIRSTMEAYACRVGFVESIGFQSTLGQAALREGIPLRDLRPVGDKVTRALPATAVMERGQLLLPAGASWRGEFEAELLSFPEGKHDDQVDAVSYGVQVYLEMFGGGSAPRSGPSKQPPRDDRGGGWMDQGRGGWRIGR